MQRRKPGNITWGLIDEIDYAAERRRQTASILYDQRQRHRNKPEGHRAGGWEQGPRGLRCEVRTDRHSHGRGPAFVWRNEGVACPPTFLLGDSPGAHLYVQLSYFIKPQPFQIGRNRAVSKADDWSRPWPLYPRGPQKVEGGGWGLTRGRRAGCVHEDRTHFLLHPKGLHPPLSPTARSRKPVLWKTTAQLFPPHRERVLRERVLRPRLPKEHALQDFMMLFP